MESVDPLKEAINRLLSGTSAEADHERIRDAFRSGRLVHDGGNRAVRVHGSVHGGVIVTGNDNQVVLNVTQDQSVHDLLQRLREIGVDHLARRADDAQARERKLAAYVERLAQGGMSSPGALAEVVGREFEDTAPRAKLQDVLINLWVVPDRRYERSEAASAQQGSDNAVQGDPTPVEALRVVERHRRVVVLGEAGAGKSTLLRQLARTCSTDATRTPVVVILRYYAAALQGGRHPALREFALAEAAAGDAALRSALEAQADAGRVLWLLDGLDEVHGWRERVVEQVRTLDGDLVITSRPYGYQPAGLETLSTFSILPLTRDDVRDFFDRWFSQAETASSTSARERTSLLLGQLEAAAAARSGGGGGGGLAHNPLVLTFIAVLSGGEGLSAELPGTRAQLFHLYADRLASAWELQRYPRDGPRGEPAVRLGPLSGARCRAAAIHGLLRLGWCLQIGSSQPGSGDLQPRRDVARSLAAVLRPYHRLSPAEDLDLAQAVIDFWIRAGLLEARPSAGGEQVAFRHVAFREFTAAFTLRDFWVRDAGRVRRVVWRTLHHPAWREVVVQFASMLPPPERNVFVAELIAGHSTYERSLARDLRLAAAVVREAGGDVEPKLARKLARRLALRAKWEHWGVTRLAAVSITWTGRVAVALLFASFYPATSKWWSLVGGVGLAWCLPSRVLQLPARLWPAAVNSEVFIRALGQLGSPQAVRVLLGILESAAENDPTRRWAIEALGDAQEPSVVPVLVRLLTTADSWTAGAAASALRRIGAASAEAALADFDRRSARPATDENVSHLPCEVRHRPEIVTGILQGRDPMKMLTEGDEKERQAGAHALGRSRDPNAVDCLIEALSDPSDRVAAAAALSLGGLGDVRAVGPLIELLGRDDDSFCLGSLSQEAAREALAQIGEPAIGPLRSVFDSGDFRRYIDAARTLLKTGRGGLEAVFSTLEHSDAKVRGLASFVLGQEANTARIDVLLAGRRGKPARNHFADLADTPVVDQALDLLRSRDENVRFAACQVLRAIGDRRAVEPLMRRLARDGNAGVRQQAASALGDLGEPAAVPALVKALSVGDRGLRTAAAEALESLAEVTSAAEPLRRTMRACWWRLTDNLLVALAAFRCLDTAASQFAKCQMPKLEEYEGLADLDQSP